MAVLAGNPHKKTFRILNGTNGTIPETHYGFNDLQVVFISANNTPASLNQSSTGAGILNFASSGDSPNDAVPRGNGYNQIDETQGGGTINGLANGDVVAITWKD